MCCTKSGILPYGDTIDDEGYGISSDLGDIINSGFASALDVGGRRLESENVELTMIVEYVIQFLEAMKKFWDIATCRQHLRRFTFE